jgi:hypothetical protein
LPCATASRACNYRGFRLQAEESALLTKVLASGEFRWRRCEMWPVFAMCAGNPIAHPSAMRENGTVVQASIDPGRPPVALLSR